MVKAVDAGLPWNRSPALMPSGQEAEQAILVVPRPVAKAMEAIRGDGSCLGIELLYGDGLR